MGSAYADALWWRYCAGATWADVARGCRMSERWCRRAVETALETIDAFGMRRVAEGAARRRPWRLWRNRGAGGPAPCQVFT